jgi:glycosyltransferase involved in cell wall biosynthesis
MPPRILLTTDAVGGVWSYSLAIAAGISALGCRCLLAVLGPAPSVEQRRAANSIAGLELAETDLPLDWTAPDERALAVAADRLDRLAACFSAATVHLHSPALAAFRWGVPVVAVAHSCVGTWWDAVHPGEPPPADFSWRIGAMARGIDAAHAVIAPSGAFAEALRRVYRRPRAIDIVHNGLAPPPPHPRRARARRVLTAGRLWDRGKNVAVLDRAAGRLDAPVEAAGPAEGADGSRFAAGHLDLLGNLAPERLRERCAESAIFAAPSRYEPFGLAVLEAAQLATPLVLADIPTFRELWQDAAVFVSPDDPASWAAILQGLLDAPQRRDALGARAAERSRLYDAAHMTAATAAIHRAAYAAAARPRRTPSAATA